MNNKTPLIWLVIGDKPGDNAQIEILAEALELPYEIRRLIPKPEFVLGKPRYKISLEHLDPEKSDELEPPWPDLIITIGRRPSMAALWIQEQSDNACKIVLLGRPKRWEEKFSLIILSPQHLMQSSLKTIRLNFPLMRVSNDTIAQARKQWRQPLSSLPKPLTAVMLGGPTFPFKLNTKVVEKLLNGINKHYQEGTIYLTTSRRTPESVTKYIKNNLPDNAILYCWKPNDTNNPYTGLMALADQFIVTGDSISMMVEIAKSGNPLIIFELPYRKTIFSFFQQKYIKVLSHFDRNHIVHHILLLLIKLGLLRYPRDLTAMQKILYEKKLAAPFGHPFITNSALFDNELQTVIDAIKRELFYNCH
ncbi:MAG: ELM1/GtrOC1 family putative glycosyltransferase [Gammaproteobacteria bacterium]